MLHPPLLTMLGEFVKTIVGPTDPRRVSPSSHFTPDETVAAPFGQLFRCMGFWLRGFRRSRSLGGAANRTGPVPWCCVSRVRRDLVQGVLCWPSLLCLMNVSFAAVGDCASPDEILNWCMGSWRPWRAADQLLAG